MLTCIWANKGMQIKFNQILIELVYNNSVEMLKKNKEMLKI